MTIPTTGTPRTRCPCCFSRAWRFSPLGQRCGFCGLVVNGDIEPSLWEELESAAQSSSFIVANRDYWAFRLGLIRPSDRILLTAHAAEILVNRLGRVLPHLPAPTSSRIRSRLSFHPAPAGHGANLRECLALGMIARAVDLEACRNLLSDCARFIGEAVILIDSEQRELSRAWHMSLAPARRQFELKVLAHPLNGNFAAQRNRVQAAAKLPWVLQLDTDERLDAATTDALPWLIADQERKDRSVVGIARLNLVDGQPSDHFPDVQYRLCRREVRYRNRVHETPDVSWRETAVFLGGVIEHHLPRERVAARSKVYEALEKGAGRPHDENRLLTPYEA